MKKLIKLLTAAALCMPLLGGCTQKSAGTAVSHDRIIVDGISWVPDPDADVLIYTKKQYLGKLEGSVDYKVYTARETLDALLCEDGSVTYTYIKEYRGMDTEIKTAFTDHGTMDYFSFGKKDGENIVVLPGLSLKSVMPAADAIVTAYSPLAGKYRVTFFDRIRELPEGYDTSAMADDTLQAMKNAGIEKAHIMGVSLGGMIAQMMALKSPDTVSSLVLCSSASRISPYSKTVFEEWKTLAESRDLRKLSESFGEHVYSPSFYEQYKEAIIAGNDGAAELDYTNFLTCLAGMKDFDLYERLPEIQCPVFVIGAGEDRILGRESSQEIIDQLGCEGFIYEGYGHAAYDEAPDYLSRVEGYIASVR